MAHKMFLRYDNISAEWEADDSMRLCREDVPQHIVLSITEWQMVLAMAALHGWPMAPPLSVMEEQGITSCTRPASGKPDRKH